MSEPSREDLARILCCPGGCVRDNECIALTRRELSPNRIDQINAILARLAAKPGRVIEEMSAVVNEMIEVATDDDDSVMAEWTSDNRAEIDKWQVRLQIAIRALKGTPA